MNIEILHRYNYTIFIKVSIGTFFNVGIVFSSNYAIKSTYISVNVEFRVQFESQIFVI